MAATPRGGTGGLDALMSDSIVLSVVAPRAVLLTVLRWYVVLFFFLYLEYMLKF
jgi:hypothetical protein